MTTWFDIVEQRQLQSTNLNGVSTNMMQLASHPSWFVRKDLDGFFGLMIDNLIQLILIVGLCRELIRLPDSYIFGKILPGAAISILVGNFFYAWQARRLARESGMSAKASCCFSATSFS